MIKVAITDDHEMVLTGLRQMLGEDPNIVLTGVYQDGQSLIDGLAQQVPDVLLLDLHLPDRSGEELAEEILKKYPQVKIMVLSSIDEIKRVRHMIQLGCKGYSLKNISQPVLRSAIQLINQGGQYMDPVLKEELLQETLTQPHLRPSYIPDVTRREKQILGMMALGQSNKEIAEKLFISVRTVENHRKSLLRKFNVKNALGLFNAARQKGILD